MNKNYHTAIIYLVIGVVIGYIIFGNVNRSKMDHNMSMDMNGAMSGMMSGLSGKTGDDFDKAFLSEMIVHHQGAVDMANAVLKNSKRPELINLANNIISAQTSEIKMMQDWQKAWFK